MTKRFTTDVAIIGGGIIGLSTAWQLSAVGLRVTLFEREHPGCGATSVAAGMLAPLAEASSVGPFTKMGLESLAMYPHFLEALRNDSGLDVRLSDFGMLRVAFSDDDAETLRGATIWQERLGLPLERLTGEEARSLEPALSESALFAVHSPEERTVDPRTITAALVEACRRRGVHFVAGEARIHGSQVLIGSDSCDAESIVVAAGTWSGFVHAALPLVPVRGEIVSARAEIQPDITIFTKGGYVVPRGDGVLIGATEEHAGYDCRNTEAGIRQLSGVASRILRGKTRIEEKHVGLRPGTPDRLPIIGRVQGNVIAATGHFRNGILLAPLTARVVTRLIRGEVEPLTDILSPQRFQKLEATV